MSQNAYMALLPVPLTEDVLDAGDYLCRHYHLKTPGISLKKIWQYVLALISYFWNIGKIRQDYLDHLERWQRQLVSEYGLKESFL